MRRVKKIAIRLFIVLACGAALVFLPGKLFPKKPLSIKVVAVVDGPVRDVVTSSTAGEVAALRHATVRAEVGARVMRVVHKRGERVRRGDVVIALDAADLMAHLAQAGAQLLGVKAQVDQAKARVQTLSRQAARAKMLADRGAAGTSASEDAENLLGEAKQAMRAQSVAVAQALAAVKVARVAVEKSRLTAPFNGLLVDVPPEAGDELTPGAAAFEIIDDSALKVEASVDEADAARISLGQPAALTLDALPGRRIEGKVALIAPAVRKDLKGARTLPLEIAVTDVKAAAAAGLRAGMSANVEIVVAEKPQVAWLPTNVIVGRGVKRTVFKVEGGKARSVPVEVGLSNWERSEIVSGLKPGDSVVATLNAKGLEDGALVVAE